MFCKRKPKEKRITTEQIKLFEKLLKLKNKKDRKIKLVPKREYQETIKNKIIDSHGPQLSEKKVDREFHP